MNYKRIDDYIDRLLDEFPEFKGKEEHFKKIMQKGFNAVYQLVSDDFFVLVNNEYLFYTAENFKEHRFRRKQLIKKAETYAKRKQLCRRIDYRQSRVSDKRQADD